MPGEFISFHNETIINKYSRVARTRKQQRFTIPSLGTLIIYVATEVLLLRRLIHIYEKPILNQSGKPIFDFDSDQSSALKSLIQAARADKPLAIVAGLAMNALHHLYFPSNPDRAAFNLHIEPLNTFFGTLCLTDDGAARPLEDVPHYCGRIQFAMRLCGFHYLFTTHARLYPQPTSYNKVPPITTMAKGAVNTQQNKSKDVKAIRRTTHARAKNAMPPSDSDSSDCEEALEENPNVNVGTMELPVVEKKVTDKGWWA